MGLSSKKWFAIEPRESKTHDYHWELVSDIFYFFVLGEGEGGVRSAGREGGRFFLENPMRGGSPGGGGAEGPGGCLRRIGNWGGG